MNDARDMTGTCPRPARRPCGRVFGSTLASMVMLALCASLAATSAQAAAPLSWSSAAIPGGGTPSAVACASESLCVAVNRQGAGFSTSNPTSPSPTWSATVSDPGQSLNAVSCAPGGLCVAVDGAGKAWVSGNPSPFSVPGAGVLTGISCPSATLCVAVDEAGGVFTSTSPGSGGWALASGHAGHDLRAVSCASTELCVAVDSAGNVLATVNPSGGWPEHKIDSEELVAVSCSVAGTCVAVDHSGHTLASADSGSPAPTWSLTPLGSEHLTAVSCTSSGLCVAVDTHGQGWASDDPTSAIPSWAASNAGSASIAGVSCLPGGFCLAVNTIGNALGGHVPAPGVKTERPAEATSVSAILAGIVNPNDAVLSVCTFEYGTSVAYAASVPCSQPPAALAANGGNQAVTAAISGLAPNTTYHYRVTATSPWGTTVGSDEAFTTAVNSLVAIVHPNPSLSGTPANGQRLTCHANTPSGSTAQLTYAWLRDLIPIAGAVGSTYTVRGQDSGHHLQCQVTASDAGGSATAKSAFVTIPIGGVPVSAGETAIGRAAFRGGRLIVPVSCSSQASGGCQVVLHLTAVETLSGGRVVAVAARASRSAHTHATALRRRTVTLVSAHFRVPRGLGSNLSVALGTSAKRLLARVRRFSASLSISGTVIGVIEAQLAQQLVTLSTGAHGASRHAPTRH
jgi:hypothetical protein